MPHSSADANERALKEKHRRAEAEDLLVQLREERSSRPLAGWFTPDALRRLLAKDVD